jgi:hypothetical protein
MTLPDLPERAADRPATGPQGPHLRYPDRTAREPGGTVGQWLSPRWPAPCSSLGCVIPAASSSEHPVSAAERSKLPANTERRARVSRSSGFAEQVEGLTSRYGRRRRQDHTQGCEHPLQNG